MSALLTAVGVMLAALVAAHGIWWTLLALAALRRPRPAPRAEQPWQFAVIVPAHDEEALIGRCLESLAAPPFTPQPEVVVVADNCSDRTAAIARARGATVLERTDTELRGKSYALRHAAAALLDRPVPPDALIVVDADSTVSEHFYAAIASALEGGAVAAQVHYEAEPGEGGAGRLRRLAFALAHWARPLGAARLGLGTGIKGSGFALRVDVAEEVLGADGLAEDAAMTLVLARRGHAVAFVPDATLRAPMAADYAAAKDQERRWERGRFGLMRDAIATGFGAFARARLRAGAAAFEVASLPLSLLLFAGLASAALAAAGFGPAIVPAIALGSLAASVTVGLAAARVPLRELTAFAGLPRFLAHRAAVHLTLVAGRGPRTWERTRRG